MPKNSKPDMRDYFKARIEYHVHGAFGSRWAKLPRGVKRVEGDVDSALIVVIMDDDTEHLYAGGKYASRKVNGCYAPLMPKPFKYEATHLSAHDGSDAMIVRYSPFTLINEDGHRWEDSSDHWKRIEE